MIGPIEQARQHEDATAIVAEGAAFTYRQLVKAADVVTHVLLAGRTDLAEARVSFMATSGFDYVSILWGIWQAGGIAVPLGIGHPMPIIRHMIEDSETSILVVGPGFESFLSPFTNMKSLRIVELRAVKGNASQQDFPSISLERRALMLYTSGTTNLPKGVVTTHRNIKAQIVALISAWKWSNSDRILCVLPLHHVHGVINIVSCSLWAGATCDFLPNFDAKKVFDIFLTRRINVFMAVPTIYHKLISYWETAPKDERTAISEALRSFRLMVSGSAALPATVMEKWKAISGHVLLERYGMTEIGMGISNPYEGDRRTGFVGMPLPGVSVRLVNEDNEDAGDGPGEIVVKGDNVFLEYWNKPETTRASFINNGWFKTGDIAVVENGYYRILGRNSVDIIKSGGYKISALEIEEILRTNPIVRDCAVVGLQDEEWGEIVAAAITSTEANPDVASVSHWLKERLPSYRVPRKFLFVTELPRNAMGKIIKGEVKKLF